MSIIRDPVTGDSCLLFTHESGMQICVAEQPGFHTASAQLGVRFGSVHRKFTADGQTVTLPAGTAHFLEHKLYENADGDAVTQYRLNVPIDLSMAFHSDAGVTKDDGIIGTLLIYKTVV